MKEDCNNMHFASELATDTRTSDASGASVKLIMYVYVPPSVTCCGAGMFTLPTAV